MPQNDFGYSHVLVVVCYLSKFVVTKPLKTKTSSEVVTELLAIFLTFGVPEICQHDQGKEFTSKVRKYTDLRFENYYFKCLNAHCR